MKKFECNTKMQNTSFLLLSHYATFAFQDLLFSYLKKHTVCLATQINLPLPELPYLKHIELTDTQKGKVILTKKINSIYKPPLVAYIFQLFQLFFLSLTLLPTYDVIIAQDSLLAILALVLRRIGKCRKVIFYSHGIDLARFKNRIVNDLYIRLDKIAATNSDFDWCLSRPMIPMRKNQKIPEKKIFWVPASIPIDSIARNKDVKTDAIVFLGVIDERNGAGLLPDIIRHVIQKIPHVRLDIIGNGKLYKNLKQRIKEMKLENNIKLLGLQKFRDYSSILTNYAVGIAPYLNSSNNLTPLTDPMKIRIYLAAGLPVITTKGFHFSREIEKNGLGLTSDFDVSSFARTLIILLQNKKMNRDMRKRALTYSKKYDIYSIYDEVFKKILN